MQKPDFNMGSGFSNFLTLTFSIPPLQNFDRQQITSYFFPKATFFLTL